MSNDNRAVSSEPLLSALDPKAHVCLARLIWNCWHSYKNLSMNYLKDKTKTVVFWSYFLENDSKMMNVFHVSARDISRSRVYIWSVSCENVSSGICGQWRPRSDSASALSDLGLHCPLTESLDTTECMNGDKRPSWYFAHAQDDQNLRIVRCCKAPFRLARPNYEVFRYKGY